MRPDVLAHHVATTIRGLLDPMALRVAALETAGAGVRARLETTIGGVHERLGALEARAPLPGPPGPPGPSGPVGPAGRDGLDGKAGLQYREEHEAGQTYDVGDLVTARGSVWYCRRTTTTAPPSRDWQLFVQRGQRGRDARGDR